MGGTEEKEEERRTGLPLFSSVGELIRLEPLIHSTCFSCGLGSWRRLAFLPLTTQRQAP